MRLRAADAGDRDRLLEWRNDPATREASRQTAAVEAGEHEAWLEAVLADADRHLLIAEDGGDPVGQIRFDRDRAYRYEISVGLAPAARGRGLGSDLIEMGCAWLWRSTNATDVEAWVRADNAPSERAFAAAGFRATGDERQGFRLHVLARPEPWAPWSPRLAELEARLSS